MVRIEFRVTAQALTAGQMAAAEDWLVRARWRSAARAAAAAFAAAGGGEANDSPRLLPRGTVAGGIFFAPGTSDQPAPPAEWFYAIAKTPGPRTEPELEIGVIGEAAGGRQSLTVWMAAWTAALAAAGTMLETDWRDPRRAVRLASLLASGAYVRPRLRLVQLEQADLLAEPVPREWLERLRQMGQLRHRDLAAEAHVAQAEIRRLAAAGLAQLPAPEDAGSSYLPAAAAAGAARDWPLLWLSERLSELGCGAIAWPRRQDDCEAMPSHVVAEFCGQRWCVVCTAAAWDDQALRSWERWQARWGPGPLLVIALGGMAAPLPPEAAGSTWDLETGGAALRTAFAAAARTYAAARLIPLEQAYGWPLAALLQQRFGSARVAERGLSRRPGHD